jgi:hypothetical protein
MNKQYDLGKINGTTLAVEIVATHKQFYLKLW